MKKNNVELNIGQNNELTAHYSRSITNDISDDYVGSKVLEVLKKVVEKYIPHFSLEKHHLATHAEILWFERYECPCCTTGVTALVKVDSSGGCNDPVWEEGARIACGIYQVTINASSISRGSRFTIQKMNESSKLTTGLITEHLPAQSERK